MEGLYGAIDADDYTCHGYYIIVFSLNLYTLQEDLSIDSQVISSGEMVCKGINFSNQYQFPLLCFSKKYT